MTSHAAFPPSLQSAGDEPALSLRTEDGATTFSFDEADYDETADRLRLTAGPACAAWTEPTAEGHLLRVSAPEGVMCGLVLTHVRRRLMSDGCIEVTFADDQKVRLQAGEIAHLLTSRRRSGRFHRTA